MFELKELKGNGEITQVSQVTVSKECHPGMCLHCPDGGREAVSFLQGFKALDA